MQQHTSIFRLFFILCLCWLMPSVSASTTTKILVMGDSLSAAYNIQQSEGWVNLLQNSFQKQSIAAELHNASISGETTSGGLNRLPRQLDLIKPDIVIIELGGNDGLRGFELDYTRDNLSKMISLSEQAGARVLLCEIKIPPNYGRRYTEGFSAIYRQLSSSKKVDFVPFLLEDVATKKGLMQADGIHPNATGQPIVARHMEKYILPLIRQLQNQSLLQQ